MTPLSPFVWRRRIGMADVDAWGIVWYGNYWIYCDEARAELLRAFDLAPSTFVALGLRPVVVEVEGRYVLPARYDEEIDVQVRVGAPRGARLPFEFELRRTSDGNLLARLATTMVLLRSTGELVYLTPDSVREPIERMLAAQQSLVEA